MVAEEQPGFSFPVNDVVTNPSDGLEYYFVGSGATPAKMIPGIRVMRDTAGTVKQADQSGNDIGFLAYIGSPAEFRPETITDHYEIGDQVGVYRKAGRRQMGYLASGQNVTNGEPLTKTTDGYLVAGTPGTDDIAADAAQDVNASSGIKAVWTVTRK